MGSKLTRNVPSASVELSREEINDLCQHTNFTEKEILDWHAKFYRDCPDGKLTLKQFEQAYAKIMGKPTPKTASFIRHMFSVYDEDNNHCIDFREFVTVLSAAPAVNRLRLIETLFQIFDLDNDGKITKDEIGKMLHTLVDVTNSQDKSTNRQKQKQNQNKTVNLQQRIDDAFNELNSNDDDHITKEEFIEWYMKSGLLSDVKTKELDSSDPTNIHAIERRSRKLISRVSSTHSTHGSSDSSSRHSQNRYISRMIERKPVKQDSDLTDDNVGDEDKNHLTTMGLSTIPKTRKNDNRNSIEDHTSNHDGNNSPRKCVSFQVIETGSGKKLDQWQHLYHSVIEHLRQQQPQQQQNGENSNEYSTQGNRNLEKRSSEDKLRDESKYKPSRNVFGSSPNILQTKVESIPLKPIASDSSSNDIITVRF